MAVRTASCQPAQAFSLVLCWEKLGEKEVSSTRRKKAFSLTSVLTHLKLIFSAELKPSPQQGGFGSLQAFLFYLEWWELEGSTMVNALKPEGGPHSGPKAPPIARDSGCPVTAMVSVLDSVYHKKTLLAGAGVSALCAR